MLLIGICKYESFIYILDIVLNLVICGADDCLESQPRISAIQLATFSASILENASSSTTRRIVGFIRVLTIPTRYACAKLARRAT